MPEPVRSDQKYLPGLDGLRAIAVAAVVLYHLNVGWAQGGLLGVGVFFTLSGYLITDILLGQWDKSGRLRLGDFWLRRARRLLPALFVMLLVVAIWVNTLARSQLPGFRGDVVASALYVSNWWYIAQHASYYAQFAPPAPLDHLWSLAVEEQFYLVWPWLVLFGVLLFGRWLGSAGDADGRLSTGARYRIAAATAVLAALSAVLMAMLYHPGTDPTRDYEGTDTRACGLLLGAALAMVWPSRRNRLPATATRLLDLAGMAGLAVIGLLVWRTNQYSPFMFRGGLVLLSLATLLVVAAVATPGSRLGRFLGLEPLRWTGVRSYGIYLWHYPLIVLTAPALTAGGFSRPRATAAAAASVVIAALSWKFVEEPVRRGFSRGFTRPKLPRGRELVTPVAVGSLCVLALAGITASVIAVAGHPASHTTMAAANSQANQARTAKPASAGHASLGQPTSSTATGQTPKPENGAGRPGSPPGHPVTAPRTSCQSVAHFGDSTSEGLISSSYLPNPADRITARYAKVGVTRSIMEIYGGTSIVETINGDPNADTLAKRLVAGGYHGCWVLALGTNDTADVYVGSNIGRVGRIKEMMSAIGSQPVLWVEVKSLLSSGPYAEQNMMAWNQALAQEQPHYPNMHIYDWPAVVQNSWFINDGIHYTSYGYAQRARLIAGALAAAFPAGAPGSPATQAVSVTAPAVPGGRHSRLRSAGQQGEVGEVEAWRHHAADQHLGVARRPRRLPAPAQDDVLRHLAGRQVRAYRDDVRRGGRKVTAAAVQQDQRAARMPQPDLVRPDTVPPRLLAGRQQEVNDGGRGSRPRVTGRHGLRSRPPGLAVPAALGVRLEVKQFGRQRPLSG
jgi:peptidoglycan/LPS O-acetylase OafA/YrhL